MQLVYESLTLLRMLATSLTVIKKLAKTKDLGVSGAFVVLHTAKP